MDESFLGIIAAEEQGTITKRSQEGGKKRAEAPIRTFGEVLRSLGGPLGDLWRALGRSLGGLWGDF